MTSREVAYWDVHLALSLRVVCPAPPYRHAQENLYSVVHPVYCQRVTPPGSDVAREQISTKLRHASKWRLGPECVTRHAGRDMVSSFRAS